MEGSEVLTSVDRMAEVRAGCEVSVMSLEISAC